MAKKAKATPRKIQAVEGASTPTETPSSLLSKSEMLKAVMKTGQEPAAELVAAVAAKYSREVTVGDANNVKAWWRKQHGTGAGSSKAAKGKPGRKSKVVAATNGHANTLDAALTFVQAAGGIGAAIETLQKLSAFKSG